MVRSCNLVQCDICSTCYLAASQPDQICVALTHVECWYKSCCKALFKAQENCLVFHLHFVSSLATFSLCFLFKNVNDNVDFIVESLKNLWIRKPCIGILFFKALFLANCESILYIIVFWLQVKQSSYNLEIRIFFNWKIEVFDMIA